MSIEDLEKIHERGGDCDDQRNIMWKRIRIMENEIVTERIALVKVSTRVAIVTGLICSVPALIMLGIEFYKIVKGC